MELSHTPWTRETAPSDSDGLEPLGWEALSARLAATHQLRRELTAGASAHSRCGTASFAPDLACAPSPAPSCESPDSAQTIQRVNLEPLANGKAADAMTGAASEERPVREDRTRGLQ